MRAWRREQSTRRYLSVAMLAGLSLVLNACISVEFRSEFERDGTATHTMAVVIPREEFEAAADPEHLALWDQIVETASEAGLNPERIDTERSVTFQVSVERPDGSDAGAALNSLLNVTGLNPSPGISAPFQGSYEQQGAAIGGTNFVLDMTVDGDQLHEALTASDETAGIPPDLIDTAVVTYEADIPGSLQMTSASLTLDDRLIWEIDETGTTELRAEASAGGTGTTLLFIAAAVASLATAVIAAGLIGWLLARRPALASSIGSAARHFPRRTTITAEGLWVAYRVRMLVDRIWHSSAPHGETPVQHDLLESANEGDDDGPDTEGDRPAAGIRGG